MPDWKMLIQYLSREYEMFSIVVFFCGVVTIMLLGFVAFHTYLICKNYTTNEFSRKQFFIVSIDKRVIFLEKWVKARDEGMKFRPAKAALEKNQQNEDLTVDMSTEDIKKALKLSQEQQESIKSGTHFKNASLMDALLRIWNPDKYDINGNTQPISLEKNKDARSFNRKTSNWAYTPIDAEVREAEAAEKAATE